MSDGAAAAPAEDYSSVSLTLKDPETGHQSIVQATNSWMYDAPGLRLLMETFGPGYSYTVNSLSSPAGIFISDAAAAAVADGDYVSFTATPASGYELNLDAFWFDHAFTKNEHGGGGAATPSTYAFERVDVRVLVIVAFGGLGTLLGPVVGAAVFAFVEEELSSSLELREVFYGVFLIAIFFITSADSGSLVMDIITAGGKLLVVINGAYGRRIARMAEQIKAGQPVEESLGSTITEVTDADWRRMMGVHMDDPSASSQTLVLLKSHQASTSWTPSSVSKVM